MVLIVSEFVYHIEGAEHIEILSVADINNDMDNIWKNKEVIKCYYNEAKNLVINNNHFGSDDQTAFIRIKIFDGCQRMLIVSGERFNTFDEIFDNRSMERFPEPVRYGIVDFDIITDNRVIKINEEFHTNNKTNLFIHEFVNSESFKKHNKNSGIKELKFEENEKGELVATNIINYSMRINAKYLNGCEYSTVKMYIVG